MTAMCAKKIALCVLVASIVATAAAAGPFGLEMGMSLEEVRVSCGGRQPVSYGGDLYTIEPEEVHPAFCVYMVRISESEGLYFVLASGEKVESVMTGEIVRERFAALKDALCLTYGDCRVEDELASGSAFQKESEWMVALAAGERKLQAVWNRGVPSCLPDNVRQIVLAVSSVSSFEARLSVSYTFANYDAVMKEVNRSL